MGKFKYLKVLITVMLVIIGLSGMGWFTWKMGQVFVDVLTSAPIDNSADAEESASRILTLSEISLWTCQIGVYQDKQNADQMLETLKVKGWKAGIIKENPHTVTIGAFSGREEAELFAARLKAEGIDSWIREESFPALQYKASGKDVEKITALLEQTNYLLREMNLQEVQTLFEGDMDALFIGKYPTDFENLNQVFYAILNKDYSGQKGQILFSQDLLELYLEYKATTTRYFQQDYR